MQHAGNQFAERSLALLDAFFVSWIVVLWTMMIAGSGIIVLLCLVTVIPAKTSVSIMEYLEMR